jgi:hypothetical protein
LNNGFSVGQEENTKTCVLLGKARFTFSKNVTNIDALKIAMNLMKFHCMTLQSMVCSGHMQNYRAHAVYEALNSVIFNLFFNRELEAKRKCLVNLCRKLHNPR